MKALIRWRRPYPADLNAYEHEHDHPLVMRYALPDDYLAPVMQLLTRERLNNRQLEAAAQIIAAAVQAHGSANPHVSYSRDRSHYTSRRNGHTTSPACTPMTGLCRP
jgi:hypothetical protein